MLLGMHISLFGVISRLGWRVAAMKKLCLRQPASVLRSHGLRAAVAADDAGGQEPQLHVQGFACWLPPPMKPRPAGCWPPPMTPLVGRLTRRGLTLAMPATRGRYRRRRSLLAYDLPGN